MFSKKVQEHDELKASHLSKENQCQGLQNEITLLREQAAKSEKYKEDNFQLEKKVSDLQKQLEENASVHRESCRKQTSERAALVKVNRELEDRLASLQKELSQARNEVHQHKMNVDDLYTEIDEHKTKNKALESTKE